MQIDRYQIAKTFALIRFMLSAGRLKKTSWKNFRYRECLFLEKRHIAMGGNNTFRNHVTISASRFNPTKGVQIGQNNIFDAYSSIVTHGGSISIGNDNFIGFRCQLQGRGEITIGNRCLIAGNVFISSSNHDTSDPFSNAYLLNEIREPVVIGDKVWIGANAVITAGVTIHNYAVIGAGAVVTRDVEPYTMVAGVPAKPIKRYDFDTKQWYSVSNN